MSVVIVGNGVLGTLSAFEFKKKYPLAEIILIGPAERPHSASAAAGAMIAVFGEYEDKVGVASSIQESIFNLSIQSRQEWLDFIENNKLKKLRTAKSTLVYLKKDASNFEKLNFESSRSKTIEHGFYNKLSKTDLASIFPRGTSHLEEHFVIEGEFAVNPDLLFNYLDEQLRKLKVRVINFNATEIDLEKSLIKLSNNTKILYSKLVLTAGANSAKILNPKNIMPIFKGFGTAIELKSNDFKSNLNPHFVLRSVNRGGAQCGIHLVPRNESTYYLGAGNYISNSNNPELRIETVRYLFQTLIDDVIGNRLAYETTGKILTGSRPKSFDGVPLLGQLEHFDNVFVATGNNRVGLTLAPKIIQYMLAWLSGTLSLHDFEFMKPDRNPIKINSTEESLSYLVNTRISNILEHGLINNDRDEISKKEDEIRANMLEKVSKVKSKFPNLEIGTIDPDNWQAVIDESFTIEELMTKFA